MGCEQRARQFHDRSSGTPAMDTVLLAAELAAGIARVKSARSRIAAGANTTITGTGTATAIFVNMTGTETTTVTSSEGPIDKGLARILNASHVTTTRACATEPSSPCCAAARYAGPRWRRSPMGAVRAHSRWGRRSPGAGTGRRHRAREEREVGSASGPARLAAPDIAIAQRLRDRASSIAVLLGRALRRSEVAALTDGRFRSSDAFAVEATAAPRQANTPEPTTVYTTAKARMYPLNQTD